MASVLINVPKRAKRGEVITVKALVSHVMETGFRRTAMGEAVPRDIINRLSCRYNGVEVFSADLHPAIAANPFFSFTTVATESGTLEFHWLGDNGFEQRAKAEIQVE